LSSRTLQHVAGALVLAGIAVAGYLTWAHYSGETVACLRSGCETVQKSSYSEVAGVPVAALGLAFYAAMFLLVSWDESENVRVAAAALAFVGVLFSAYLLVLQAFVIHAFCIWCVANDVLIAPGLALVTGLRLRAATS
jgi:uncharacterized membrane protein